MFNLSSQVFQISWCTKRNGNEKKVKIQLSSSKISLLAQNKTVTWGRGEYHNTILLVVKKEIKYMYVITFSVQHKEKIHIYTSAHIFYVFTLSYLILHIKNFWVEL